MNRPPIGLTRAEEAAEHPAAEPRIVVRAEPGRPVCRVALPSGGDCLAEAVRVIVWHDGQTTLACVECAERMRQLAGSHRTTLRIEPLP
jgi:hypothetical protein